VKDREIAAQVDAMDFAISVRLEGGLLIAEAERNDIEPASAPSATRLVRTDGR
jgi:hypothetical protein